MGNIDIAQFLINHGADANLADKWRHSLLHRALQRREPDVLVKGGADVNARGRPGPDVASRLRFIPIGLANGHRRLAQFLFCQVSVRT